MKNIINYQINRLILHLLVKYIKGNSKMDSCMASDIIPKIQITLVTAVNSNKERKKDMPHLLQKMVF